MRKKSSRQFPNDEVMQRHYWVWAAMIQRCTNPNNKQWSDYGARGVSVCREWRQFSNFLASMSLRPSDNHTLERVNNDSGYGPGNCIWAPRTTQARNKRAYRKKASAPAGVDPRDNGKFRARIRVNRKSINLGTYLTAEEAAQARLSGLRDHGFSEKHGR